VLDSWIRYTKNPIDLGGLDYDDSILCLYFNHCFRLDKDEVDESIVEVRELLRFNLVKLLHLDFGRKFDDNLSLMLLHLLLIHSAFPSQSKPFAFVQIGKVTNILSKLDFLYIGILT
jgi:hypothetical protein